MQKPRLAVIGCGGFAEVHHEAVWELEKQGLCQLVATCEPSVIALETIRRQYQFEPRQVRVFDDFEQLITQAKSLDLVLLPVPLMLHQAMHRRCVEAGIPCLLEKPPSLYGPQLEEMMAVDRQARCPTQVGFNWLDDPARHYLKDRLLSGEFGSLLQINFLGLWPRPASYYRSSNWKGRLFVGEEPVLDSCLGNAMAHFVNLLLWWSGSTLEGFDEVGSVEAELYRAYEIETYDTAFVSSKTPEGRLLRIAASHACPAETVTEEQIICEQARIIFREEQEAFIAWKNGHTEPVPICHRPPVERNVATYLEFLSGRRSTPLITLEQSRPFVRWVNLIQLAGGGTGHRIPDSMLQVNVDGQKVIPDIRELAHEFLHHGKFPHEHGIPWAQTYGQAKAKDLTRFPQAVQAWKNGRVDALLPA